MRRAYSISAAVLAAIGLVSAGSIGALLAAPPAVPPGLVSGEAPKAAPVTQQRFADTRSVKVSLSLSDPVPLTANTAGKVTASKCSAGSELASGSTVLSVDGVTLVALATSVPLWRDLTPSDKGKDVTALQEELVRLGYDVAVDGYYGWWTRVALADLMEKAGGSLAPGGVLPLARTVWIPSAAVTVQGCEVRVGDSISTAGAIATLPAVLQAVSVTDVPVDLLPGARTLDFGEFQLPTDEEGRVTDPKALSAVTGSRLYPGLLAEAKGDGITVDWSLAEQVDVLAVPPRALYAQNGSTACLQPASGAPLKVVVVAASLGQSLVSLTEKGKVPDQVSLAPDEEKKCD